MKQAGTGDDGTVRIRYWPVVVSVTLVVLCCGMAMMLSDPAAGAERHYIVLVARGDDQAAGERESYLRGVRQRIEANRLYPLPARRCGQEGRVGVAFTIGHAGNLERVALASPCRHRILNQAALEAVRQAAPFPAPPAHLFPDTLALSVELVFAFQGPSSESAGLGR